MSEKIEPALSAEEWRSEGDREWVFPKPENPDYFHAMKFVINDDDTISITEHWSVPGKLPIAQVIALANAALPDSDPRKITREKIRQLRTCIATHAEEYDYTTEDTALVAAAMAFTDALEFYLPPSE